MSPADSPQHRILVVANETCPCPTLADEVERRASTTPTDVLVVAPALNSRLRHWVSDTDAAWASARARVDVAVAELQARGVPAQGDVGDADPLLAIADALATFLADELVIATHPPGRSNWLERRLVDRARVRFELPIAHLVSTYGLADTPLAA